MIKHSADYMRADFNKLVEQNANLQKFLDKKSQMDERKIKNKHAQKILMDQEVKNTMLRNE